MPRPPEQGQPPVVVLGGSGMLGQALVRECGRLGRPVLGLSRANTPDLASLDSADALLDPLRPGLVINAAAMTSIEECERQPERAQALHAHLPGLLADWADRRQVPWVQVSTDHYYSGAHNQLHDELAPASPPNAYARSKLAGEAAAAGSPYCLTLRTSIVGRRGWPGQPSFAEWAVAALRAGRPFDAYRDVWSSSIAVDQFAKALFEMLARGARGLYNLAARDAVSKADFILALARSLALDATHCRVVERPALGALCRANAMGLDVGRAEALLGHALPDSAQVIQALALAFTEPEHAPA